MAKWCRRVGLSLLLFMHGVVPPALIYLLSASAKLAGGVLLFQLALLGLVVFMGDCIILAAVRAKKVVSHNFEDRVDNFRCLLALSKPQVFSAENLAPGIYVLQGGLKRNCLVFGGDILERLSREELGSLIYLSMLRIKKLNLRFIQVCNCAFFIAHLPIFLSRRFASLKYLVSAMGFLLLPLEALKFATFDEDRRYLEETSKYVPAINMRENIGTAHFKLRGLQHKMGEREQILLAHLCTEDILPAGLSPILRNLRVA